MRGEECGSHMQCGIDIDVQYELFASTSPMLFSSAGGQDAAHGIWGAPPATSYACTFLYLWLGFFCLASPRCAPSLPASEQM